MSSSQIDAVKSGDITKMPWELLKLIATRFLSREDIVHLCETSKKFNDRLCQYSEKVLPRDRFDDLWRILFKRDISEITESEVTYSDGQPDWHQAYQEAVKIFSDLTYSFALRKAAGKGYEELLIPTTKEEEEILRTRLKTIGREAAKHGHRHIIETMAQLVPEESRKDYYYSMIKNALIVGQVDLVKDILRDHGLAIERMGLNNLDDVFEELVKSGNVKVLEWIQRDPELWSSLHRSYQCN